MDVYTKLSHRKKHSRGRRNFLWQEPACIHSPGREAGKKNICPKSCQRSGETWSLIPQPRDKSVKEVGGLMSTARSQISPLNIFWLDSFADVVGFW